MSIRISRFDQRIRFERATETKSAGAAITRNWKEFATCWAWPMSEGGTELNEANKLTAKHTWKVRTRYRDDVRERDRIVYGAKYLYISSISHDSSRSDITEFLCSETPNP